MELNPLVITIISTLGGATVLKLIISHFLNRGKVEVEEAETIRKELRAEIDRKDMQIQKLVDRIDALEADAQRAKGYKLSVYQTLINAGAGRELLDAVLAIQ